MNIPVLYQDEAIIVVEKPIELPVHKNDFMPNDAPYLTKLIGDETGKWIYNVHRLDSKTSGVMVLALSSEVASVLTKQFEQKEVQKTYYAIVQGNPGEGTFDSKVLVKKKSKFKKPAVTHYKTLRTVQTKLASKDKTDIELSLVEIKPETGRWHQLRQHFAKNRFDIIGDTHHGDFALNKIILADTDIRRLFLHAGKLEFKHPVTSETVSFDSPIPEEFDRLLNFYES
ncbi:tRNA pseudouridine synthase C [Draconibacterium orientale]|uniref:tRNA pseudouridine synthase C n=1 Tax=Draconibacterium orientale TaxID=1168034 RepID=A0A1I0HSL1_9BACT|nr:pseudouridine synthase [Draconibacterium orientale]SET87184.1 tRNA pseudouridine synthase C [Draconibacterium orientale]